MTSTGGRSQAGRWDVAARRDGAFFAAAGIVFVAGVAATVYLCRSMADGMSMPGGWTMSMAWMKMPDQAWAGAAAAFTGVWLLMTIAMMLPSLVAMLVPWRRAARASGVARLGGPTLVASAGYFLVWSVAGVAIYPLGIWSAMAAMQWPAVARLVPLATGLAVLAGAVVQLTPWKARQLSCCRIAPAAVSRLPGPGAWRHGLRLGVRCTLCCGSLMAMLLVAGVMDLGAMALVAAAITFERIAPRPAAAARAVGIASLVVGAVIVARALLGGGRH
jgi:predicted metal-binding membrane protein